MFLDKKDLLLFAKTDFSKKLISKQFSFFIAISEVFLTLILLKLLLVEQSKFINTSLKNIAIVFYGKKSSNSMFD